MREALRARDVVRRLLDFARQSESTRSRASLNESLKMSLPSASILFTQVDRIKT